MLEKSAWKTEGARRRKALAHAMDARNGQQHVKTFAGLKETGHGDLYHASLVLLCCYLLSIGCLHYYGSLGTPPQYIHAANFTCARYDPSRSIMT